MILNGISVRASDPEAAYAAVEDLRLQVQNLAMTVRMLCHQLKKHDPDNALIKRAMEYQVREGLTSPLRGDHG